MVHPAGVSPNALEQRAARRAIHPGPLIRLIVNRPLLIFVCTALVSVLAVVVIAVTHTFQLIDPTGVDYLVRNDLRTIQDAARRAAHEVTGKFRNTILPPPATRQAISKQQPWRHLSASTRDTSNVADIERGDEIDVYGLSFVFRVRPRLRADPVRRFEDAKNAPNVLTPEYIAKIKQIEDEFVASRRYNDFCWMDIAARTCSGERPPCGFRNSITMHPLLYGLNNSAGRICGFRQESKPLSESQFTGFLNSLVVSGPSRQRIIDPQYAWFLGKDAAAAISNDESLPRTFVIRSRFPFGLPLRGFETVDIHREQQDAKYKQWADDVAQPLQNVVNDNPNSRLHLMIIGDEFVNSIFGRQALKDLSFAVLAIVLVMLFIWLHTNSFLLALSAMLQVLLAFPLAYFVYRLISQVLYFSALQIMCIFLILGIAADDCFVFVDAWKQAAVVLGARCDLERRLAWTFHRAVKAMSVTSFTTAMAFALTATSPIMPIGTLGIWAALLVVLQYVLVITMFPCAVIFWHRNIRPRGLRNCYRKEEEPRVFTPEDDDVGDNLEQQDMSDVLPREELSESTSPQETGSTRHAEHLADDQSSPRMSWWKKRFSSCSRDENDYRSIELFFRDRWVVWVNKIRFLLLFVIVGLFAVSIYLSTRLRPLTESEQFLPSSHPIRVAFTLLRDAFPVSDTDNVVVVYLLWGVAGVDRSDASKYKPTEAGSVIFDSKFDLKPAETQRHLLKACEMLESSRDLVSASFRPSSECWIKDFQQWRVLTNKSRDFESYRDDESLMKDLRAFFGFTNETSRGVSVTPFYKYLVEQQLGFTDDPDRVVFTEFRFVTDVKGQEPYGVMWPFYEKWRNVVTRLNKEAPPTANNAFAVSPYNWSWMITQHQLVRNALIGVATMIGVALIVLSLSTLNVVVSFWGVVCISGIVLNLLAFIYLFGWELGITESVGLIIATGISFDYASHIANAYIESNETGRYDRMRDALTNLGISVLAGAVSTIVSGSMLFFAVITFFGKFAAFVVSTVSLSLVWSTLFLPAMLLVFGPQQNFGSIRPIFARLKVCFENRNKSNRTDTSDGSGNIASVAKTCSASDVDNEQENDGDAALSSEG